MGLNAVWCSIVSSFLNNFKNILYKQFLIVWKLFKKEPSVYLYYSDDIETR